MWLKFFKNVSDKRNTPAPATQEDVASGKAVFFVPGAVSRVYDLGVPLPAEGYLKRPLAQKQGDAIAVGTPVTIVQAQTGPKGKVFIGAIIGAKKFVCTLDDIALGKAATRENRTD